MKTELNERFKFLLLYPTLRNVELYDLAEVPSFPLYTPAVCYLNPRPWVQPRTRHWVCALKGPKVQWARQVNK